MLQIEPFSADDVLVGRIAEFFALWNDMDSTTANMIGKAAALHDIGKYRIPSHILDKSGELTPDEFKIVKTHTVWGYNTFKNLQGDFEGMARNICMWHHEKYDNSGYWGKPYDEIPPYVPIVSICDVYVALTSQNRQYKQAWTHRQALENIKEESGKQFCPELVNSFLAMMAIYQDNLLQGVTL